MTNKTIWKIKTDLVFYSRALISSLLTQLQIHFPVFSPYITQVLKHTQVSVTPEVQSSKHTHSVTGELKILLMVVWEFFFFPYLEEGSCTKAL